MISFYPFYCLGFTSPIVLFYYIQFFGIFNLILPYLPNVFDFICIFGFLILERVAAWLSNDNAVWLALMSDEDPSKREAATNRLTRIHPGVIQFDPHAEEAERSKQLVLLRSRLGAAVE